MIDLTDDGEEEVLPQTSQQKKIIATDNHKGPKSIVQKVRLDRTSPRLWIEEVISPYGCSS